MTGKMSTDRKLLLVGLFAALSISLGFLLSAVPNVELMTLTIFLSGVFLGVKAGASVGVISISIYSLFNPFGAPMPQLLFAQITGFAVIGAAGGIVSPLFDRIGRKGSVLLSGIVGMAVTLIYDLMTTIATTLIVSGTEGFFEALKGVFITGSFFLLIHVVSNTVLFALSVVSILEAKKIWEKGRAV
ncbi:hypothetical protein DRQ05_02800 [bacterium]|nr:MAG: hypothetical protein DRQ05_02800 [bacterium]